MCGECRFATNGQCRVLDEEFGAVSEVRDGDGTWFMPMSAGVIVVSFMVLSSVIGVAGMIVSVGVPVVMPMRQFAARCQ